MKRYGEWAGDPHGYAGDPDRCVKVVKTQRGSYLFMQCRFKKGHGPGGAYCKIHAKKLAWRLAQQGERGVDDDSA